MFPLALIALACQVVWLPPAVATPVQDEIIAREPTEIPQFTSALISLYFDTIRLYAQGARSEREVHYDAPTALHAIALSRVSGVPFDAQDLMDLKAARTRTSQALQAVIPDLEDIRSSLALGVPRIQGSVTDLPYAILNSLDERVERTHRLTQENALSGLALLVNGIRLDPHLLVDSVEVARNNASSGTATLSSTPGAEAVITREAVLAASTLFQFGHPFPGSLIASLELAHADEVVAAREVALPEQRALAAIALAKHGVNVAADDLLDVHAISRTAIDESRAVAFTLEDVLLVLTLGFRAA